ncbi:MAG: tetratricopeptide repeat protein [Thermodesulfobacteriota bacterium]
MRKLVSVRLLFGMMLLGCLLLVPGFLLAADYAAIDALDDEVTIDNYKQAITLCEKALAENPNDFEAAWRCARAYRWYGELSKRAQVEGWKDICAKYGKDGMNMAQKAIDQQPNKPDGYYWYALNVGIYSDGVSILTALKEGLKNKTQESFEKVYATDKLYEEAGSILGLGRFWAVLPWPLNDKDLSLKYYREYQKTEFFGQKAEGPIYLAELLIQMGGDENKAEAKSLLQEKLKTDSKYFLDWKDRLLKDAE